MSDRDWFILQLWVREERDGREEGVEVHVHDVAAGGVGGGGGGGRGEGGEARDLRAERGFPGGEVMETGLGEEGGEEGRVEGGGGVDAGVGEEGAVEGFGGLGGGRFEAFGRGRDGGGGTAFG